MSRIRATLLSLALVLVTLYCVSIQWVLLRLRLPVSRTFPIHFHRMICRVLGVRREVRGSIDTSGPVLIVSNHVSWLDIPVIGSLTTLSFVAKKEIDGWPFFGWMTRLQRSIFIDRNRKRGAWEANHELSARLKAGDAIVLFAEGTSSDGNRVLPFKSAVVGAAEQALRESHLDDMHVQPMAIAYVRAHGLPIGRQNRARYAWYGDMDLMPHIWGVVGHGPIDVVVAFGRVHKLSEFANRKELTRSLESEVRRLFAEATNGRPVARRGRERGVKADLPAAYPSAGA